MARNQDERPEQMNEEVPWPPKTTGEQDIEVPPPPPPPPTEPPGGGVTPDPENRGVTPDPE